MLLLLLKFHICQIASVDLSAIVLWILLWVVFSALQLLVRVLKYRACRRYIFWIACNSKSITHRKVEGTFFKTKRHSYKIVKYVSPKNAVFPVFLINSYLLTTRGWSSVKYWHLPSCCKISFVFGRGHFVMYSDST